MTKPRRLAVSAAGGEVVVAAYDVEVECPCSGEGGDYGKAWIRLAPDEALELARQLASLAGMPQSVNHAETL